MAGAGGESGGDDGPNRADGAGSTDPLDIEPGAGTKALIAELRLADNDVIVNRIIADSRVILAVVRLKQAKIDAVAQGLSERLPTLAEQSKKLAEDPLIHSFIAMMSVDIRKQIIAQLGIPEEKIIPPAPGGRVEPPSPPENPGGLDRQA